MCVLEKSAHSKKIGRRKNDEASFMANCTEIIDKHFLCEQTASSVLHSAVRDHTQTRIKQSIEEDMTSPRQNCSPNEVSSHMEEERSSEDRGDSCHLQYRTTSEDDELFMDSRNLPLVRSPIKNMIVSADTPQYRKDCPEKCSPTVNPIQRGDHPSVEHTDDSLQNTSLVETFSLNEGKVSSKDGNGYLRPNIPSEAIREIGERFTLKNGTQSVDEQFVQNPGPSRSRFPLNAVRQMNSQQRPQDENIPLQRSTVLVTSADWTFGRVEASVQQIGAASDAQESNLFSAEDTALRSRVLVLLWVLLGERRLCEVGYPAEPVHRLLWRAVDVCCSVAGVKSAAPVPLNADHDCGLDMLCFRDHTHRFLEVCAPTREHWKQFGWASLTVDAVVRKIYDEGKRCCFTAAIRTGSSTPYRA
jgi:hypothetical protein